MSTTVDAADSSSNKFEQSAVTEITSAVDTAQGKALEKERVRHSKKLAALKHRHAIKITMLKEDLAASKRLRKIDMFKRNIKIDKLKKEFAASKRHHATKVNELQTEVNALKNEQKGEVSMTKDQLARIKSNCLTPFSAVRYRHFESMSSDERQRYLTDLDIERSELQHRHDEIQLEEDIAAATAAVGTATNKQAARTPLQRDGNNLSSASKLA